jgi:RHS repeat-associated protein
MSKTVGSSTTYYLYDGDALIAEVDASTDQVTRSYTWGADGLVSDHSGTQSRFYLFDALGDARSLLDTNGNLLASAAYTAYGTPIVTPLPSTPFGWQGQAGCYSDSATGLVYMQARCYSPSLGRFLSRYPIGFDGGFHRILLRISSVGSYDSEISFSNG